MDKIQRMAREIYSFTDKMCFYVDIETNIGYYLYEKPVLLIPDDKKDAWGDPIYPTISFGAIVRGTLFADIDNFSEESEPEIYVRTYDVELEVKEEELPKLIKYKNDILSILLMDRKAVKISEQLYTLERFDEILKNGKRFQGDEQN